MTNPHTPRPWPSWRDVRNSVGDSYDDVAEKLKELVDALPDGGAEVAAVKAEIERQQAAVNYDEMSKEELERAVASLQERLALCQSTLAARGAAFFGSRAIDLRVRRFHPR